MSFVGRLAGKLGADNGNDRRQDVGEVVDRVERHGDGAGHQTDSRLEACKEDVGKDPDGAGAYDHFFSVQFIHHL